MLLRNASGAVEDRARAAVAEHWSTKLEAACQALARVSGREVTSARVSQRGCGAPDEARLLGALARHLARDLGLTASVRPTSSRLSVVFERPEPFYAPR